MNTRKSIAGFAGHHLRHPAENRRYIVPGRWLEALKEEESKHNTAAALREEVPSERIGGDEKDKTPVNLLSKTSKTPEVGEIGGDKKAQTPINPPSKTSNTPEAAELGLVASWSAEFGYVSIHDPIEGVWWDVQVKDAPDWAVSEARKRKELYRDGSRRAYRLTSREIGEIWADDHRDHDEGIVEDHPVEEES